MHPLQLVDEDLPETAHDFRVDIVVTPDEAVRTGTRRRSPGVIGTTWTTSDRRLPVLAARRP